MARWVKLWAVCASLSLLAGGAGAIPLVTTSSSGRFMGVGRDARENTGYTRWAEDIATGLERLLGLAIPVPLGRPVEIVLADGRFRREDLVRLLLAGVVEGRRHEAGLPGLVPQLPQWFIMGLSQNLDPEGLAVSRKIAASSGLGMDAVPASEIMGWTQLPDGWHSRQALCGLATAWILSFPDGAKTMLDRLARQEPVTPEWLASKVVKAGSVSRMDAHWRAWAERQGRLIQEFGGLSSGMIAQLRRGLSVEVPVAVAGSRTPQAILLRPEGVLARRREFPATPVAAMGEIERIRVLTLGKAPELVEAGERYVRFYEGVACGAWDMTLKWRLAKANAALARLEQLTRAREAYLDEAEETPSAVAEAPLLPELEKSRLESYLDEAEKRFHKPEEKESGFGVQ